MPGPLLLPLISAGSNITGQAINAASTASQNKKQRKFTEKMYQRQREDSLSDYHMQNEYNHPSAQMARLREAGLNPNLVYDNGAQMASASVRSSSPGSYNPRPIQFDPGSALGAFQNTMLNQATVDNLRAQNTVLTNEAFLKTAQAVGILASTENTKTQTETGRFQLDMMKQLQANTIAKANQELANMGATGANIQANTKSTLDENERRALQNVQSLQEGYQRIINLRLDAKSKELDNVNKEINNMINSKTAQEQIDIVKYQRRKLMKEIDAIKANTDNSTISSQLNDLDLQLRRQGINPSDPSWQRRLVQFLDKVLSR